MDEQQIPSTEEITPVEDALEPEEDVDLPADEAVKDALEGEEGETE